MLVPKFSFVCIFKAAEKHDSLVPLNIYSKLYVPSRHPKLLPQFHIAVAHLGQSPALVQPLATQGHLIR